MNEQMTPERVKELRKEKGVTQTELGKIIGLDKVAVSNIETGRRGISASENTLLNAYFFGVIPESVTTPPIPSSLVLHFDKADFRIVQEAARRADMLTDEWGEHSLLKLAQISADDAVKKILAFEAEQANGADNIIQFATVPCYPVAAGKPITGDEDTAEIPAHLAADHFAVRVFGDSMEPEVKDGQVVIIMAREKLRRPMLKKGFIYTFTIDGQDTLKRYNTRKATKKEIDAGKSYVSKVDGQTKVKVLESLNPAYPEIVLCPEDEPQMTGWYNPEVQL